MNFQCKRLQIKNNTINFSFHAHLHFDAFSPCFIVSHYMYLFTRCFKLDFFSIRILPIVNDLQVLRSIISNVNSRYYRYIFQQKKQLFYDILVCIQIYNIQSIYNCINSVIKEYNLTTPYRNDVNEHNNVYLWGRS